MTTIVESPELAIGVTLAFNSIGWDSQNILFNLADAVLGLGIGDENPALTIAIVTGHDDLGVRRDRGDGDAPPPRSRPIVETSATTFSASLTADSTAIGVDIVVAMNRLSTQVKASIEDAPAVTGAPSIDARAGNVEVIASDDGEHLRVRRRAGARGRRLPQQRDQRQRRAQHRAQRDLDRPGRGDPQRPRRCRRPTAA